MDCEAELNLALAQAWPEAGIGRGSNEDAARHSVHGASNSAYPEPKTKSEMAPATLVDVMCKGENGHEGRRASKRRNLCSGEAGGGLRGGACKACVTARLGPAWADWHTSTYCRFALCATCSEL